MYSLHEDPETTPSLRPLSNNLSIANTRAEVGSTLDRKEGLGSEPPEGAHDTSSGPCKESIARHHVALCLYRPDQVVESDTHLATQELRQVSYREYHNHSAFHPNKA